MQEPPSKQAYQHPVPYWVALLIPFCIICLALILFSVKRIHPRTQTMQMPFPPVAQGAGAEAEQPPERSLWEKLLSSDREDPQTGANRKRPPDQWTKFWEQLKQQNRKIETKRGSAKNRDKKNGSGAGGGGPSQIARVVNDDHLALRQQVLAEAIIRYRDGANPGGNRRVKQSVANGPYRQQEEDRYEMERIWLLYHDGKATKKDLADMATVTNRMVKSPYVSFEDYASCGMANALSGDSKTAMALLSQALSIWPARDRMRGEIYLFLTCMAGVNGNDATFYNMLIKFKDNFPDWLYVETYLPHLKRLKIVYPDSPVMDIFHGHVMTIVHNHAEARRSYDAALTSSRLSGDLRRRILTMRRMLIHREEDGSP